MPDITPVVRPSDPTVEIIRRAVNAAHAAGLTVSTVPDLGVHCTSTHAPRWEVEQRVQVVSPLGAVLLMIQPTIPDADKALSHVLGVGKLWVIGFDEACGGAKQVSETSRLYGEGFAAGAEFRAVMHLRQGVPVARPAEVTEPVQIDTPRSLIAELLAALTPSQGMEALADSCRARAEGLPADMAEDLAVVEHTLREMAAELRGVG